MWEKGWGFPDIGPLSTLTFIVGLETVHGTCGCVI